MTSHHKNDRSARRQELERKIRIAQTMRLDSYIERRVRSFRRRLIAAAEKRLQRLIAMRPMANPPRPPPIENRRAKDARYYYKPFNHFRQVAYRQLRRLSGT